MMLRTGWLALLLRSLPMTFSVDDLRRVGLTGWSRVYAATSRKHRRCLQLREREWTQLGVTRTRMRNTSRLPRGVMPGLGEKTRPSPRHGERSILYRLQRTRGWVQALSRTWRWFTRGL